MYLYAHSTNINIIITTPFGLYKKEACNLTRKPEHLLGKKTLVCGLSQIKSHQLDVIGLGNTTSQMLTSYTKL